MEIPGQEKRLMIS